MTFSWDQLIYDNLEKLSFAICMYQLNEVSKARLLKRDKFNVRTWPK